MNQSPKKQQKNVNRVLYAVTVTMLFAIAVVIAATSSANKSKKPQQTPMTDEQSTEMPKAPETEAEKKVTPPVTTENRETKNFPATDKTETEKETESTLSDDITVQTSFTLSKLTLPVSGVLSKRHDTELQVYSATMNDYRVHNGIDVVTEAGAPVYAACGGEVTQIWDDPLMGRCLAIKHGEGCYTVYKNLSEESVVGIEVGVSVGEGQLIASVGETAMTELAEEPHLHFELTVGGEATDPLTYFDASSLASLDIDASFES